MPNAIPKPKQVYGRTEEWRALTNFVQHGTLGIVSGRRRHGKSFLLRHLTEQTGGFYHQAIQINRQLALARLSNDVQRFLKSPTPVRFNDWTEAITTLSKLNVVVALDEFPYLTKNSPELPSVIQAVLDDQTFHASDKQPRSKFILCGSSLSVMSQILSGQAPLRGRATLDLTIHPFDYRSSAQFWKLDSRPQIAFVVNAILGGAPGYLNLMGGHTPDKLQHVGKWLSLGPLNPTHALFTEDDYLLREETQLSDRSHYLSVFSAVASGKLAASEIAGALGKDSRSIHHSLRSLERAGLLTRNEDLLRSSRPTYSVTDPIIRFARVVTQAEVSRFELGRWQEAYKSREDAIQSSILGPHFEQLARQFSLAHADPQTTGGTPSRTGFAFLSDPKTKTKFEIDVVNISQTSGRKPKIISIGEAKYSTSLRQLSDIQRLETIRETIQATKSKQFETNEMKLLLFAKSGFSKEVHQQTRTRADIELIDMERLYIGN